MRSPTRYQRSRRWEDDKQRLHRLDGPAIEWASGIKEWYVCGCWYREQTGSSEFIDMSLRSKIFSDPFDGDSK